MGQTKSPVECFYNVYFSFVGGVDNMKKHIEALKLKKNNGDQWRVAKEGKKETLCFV